MNKLELLQEELRNYGKVAIAYSGGVDSNFLFHVSLETLGTNSGLKILITAPLNIIPSARNGILIFSLDSRTFFI